MAWPFSPTGTFPLNSAGTSAFPGKVLASADWNTLFGELTVGLTSLGNYTVYVFYAAAYGVVADGTTDNSAFLALAFDAANAAGGGVVQLPAGVVGLSDEFAWGDGTNSAPSTKYNKIHLRGQGAGLGFGAGQALGTTVLRYIGAGTDNAKAVINLKGPLHTIQISDLEIDAADKFGYGIIYNHVTDFEENTVTVRRWRTNHRLFTTRTGFPSGGPWGCGNGVLFSPYAYDPTLNTAGGFKYTSGVNPASSLVGNPASSNIDVIGGVCFYGGTVGSYGAHFNGADNNTMAGVQLIPQENTGGNSIFFEQWTGSPTFPLENSFNSVGMTQDVGGTSGTGGNTFLLFNTGDGAAVPSMANVFVVATTDGRNLPSPGTVSLPSHSFAIDPNTGIYRLAADTLGFACGGVLSAYIDNIGNFAITRSGGVSTMYLQRTDAHGPGTVIGQFLAQGRDSAAGFDVYAACYATCDDNTSGSEDGSWFFQTVVAGTLVDQMKISRNATAANTALLIWDNDNAAVERVTVGAADSGGAGFKVLRIPN